MNTHRNLLPIAAAAALLLTACATRGTAPDQHADMDPEAMCAMHKKMTGSMTPEQQKAMMDEHMKDLSPEMRTRMQEMHARCK